MQPTTLPTKPSCSLVNSKFEKRKNPLTGDVEENHDGLLLILSDGTK